MAKGKTLTYLLMAGVVAVWGLIFYRVYIGMSEEDLETPMTASAKVPYFKMVDHHQDQVNLDLNYRDPFSPANTYVETKPVASKLENVAAPRPAMPGPMMSKPQVNWSNVQYTGYVNNATSKQKMVILSVNGNTAVLTEGQSAHGVKLLKYLGDSVSVQYQGEKKNIKIK